MNNRRRLRSKAEISLYDKGLLYLAYIGMHPGVEFVTIRPNELESYKEKYKHDLHMLIGPEEDEKCE